MGEAVDSWILSLATGPGTSVEERCGEVSSTATLPTFSFVASFFPFLCFFSAALVLSPLVS